MPELPEVETVVRSLAPLVQGQPIEAIHFFDKKLHLPEGESLLGQKIRRTFRLGKEVVLELEAPFFPQGEAWIRIHLRMTGSLRWLVGGDGPPPRRHLRVQFILKQGELLFYDVRRFGTLKLCLSREELQTPGLDPLSPECSLEVFSGLLERSPQPIKPWLIRQNRLVGIGNIYASEILFASRLHPLRPAKDLSVEEQESLFDATQAVLKQAIECGGTTMSDFQDVLGQQGRFQEHLFVYGRKDEPCLVCQTPVERITQQGRSTFFCPHCQPLPAKPSSEG